MSAGSQPTCLALRLQSMVRTAGGMETFDALRLHVGPPGSQELWIPHDPAAVAVTTNAKSPSDGNMAELTNHESAGFESDESAEWGAWRWWWWWTSPADLAETLVSTAPSTHQEAAGLGSIGTLVRMVLQDIVPVVGGPLDALVGHLAQRVIHQATSRDDQSTTDTGPAEDDTTAGHPTQAAVETAHVSTAAPPMEPATSPLGRRQVPDSRVPKVRRSRWLTPGVMDAYEFVTDRGLLFLREGPWSERVLRRAHVVIAADHECLGPPHARWMLAMSLGSDVPIVRALHTAFEGRGYVRSLATGKIYTLSHGSDVANFRRDPASWLLFKFGTVCSALFLVLTATALTSFVLHETQRRVVRFTLALGSAVRSRRPVFRLVCAHSIESMVFVPIMIGVLFFLFEFFSDKLLAFLVFMAVWACEIYAVVACRTEQTIRVFPVVVLLTMTWLNVYHLSYPHGLHYLAIATVFAALQCSAFHQWTSFELPALHLGHLTEAFPRQILTISPAQGLTESAIQQIRRGSVGLAAGVGFGNGPLPVHATTLAAMTPHLGPVFAVGGPDAGQAGPVANGGHTDGAPLHAGAAGTVHAAHPHGVPTVAAGSLMWPLDHIDGGSPPWTPPRRRGQDPSLGTHLRAAVGPDTERLLSLTTATGAGLRAEPGWIGSTVHAPRSAEPSGPAPRHALGVLRTPNAGPATEPSAEPTNLDIVPDPMDAHLSVLRRRAIRASTADLLAAGAEQVHSDPSSGTRTNPT